MYGSVRHAFNYDVTTTALNWSDQGLLFSCRLVRTAIIPKNFKNFNVELVK